MLIELEHSLKCMKNYNMKNEFLFSDYSSFIKSEEREWT